MPKERPIAWPGWPYWFTTTAFAVVAPVLLRMKVLGRRHVPRRGPAVLLANHESFLDPYLVTSTSWRPYKFLAKIELFQGFGAWLFPRLNCIPVKRGAADLQAFRLAGKQLDEGGLLCMFVEGTRSADGALQDAQRGAVSIALRSGAPILPVAISGTYESLPRQGGFRLAPIAIAVGPPLVIEDLPPDAHRDKDALARVGAQVMEAIAALRADLESRYGTGQGRHQKE